MLLATKLLSPPLRSSFVSRVRILEQFRVGLTSKFILVSAPAGFGKTTVVREWLSSEQHQPDLPFVWLSLDENDNDIALFFAYLVAALRRISPSCAQMTESMLKNALPLSSKALMTAIINDIATLMPKFLLVLDDFHVIHTSVIHEAIALLLDNMPQQMHIVIITRTDPTLPLPRLRSHGQLIEIGAEILRFRQDEIIEYFNNVMSLGLSVKDISLLGAKTEGWIAGLQMAALSLRGYHDPSEFVATFTGRHRYILDYLVDEVLAYQQEEVIQFLLQTSILSRMSATLCNAVTGNSNGQHYLELLEAANLFIVPLDNERLWYRYHHLFADLLRHRVQRTMPEDIVQLHERASAWYEDNQLVLDAVSHALMAQDYDRAGRLIAANVRGMLMAGQLTTISRWVDALTKNRMYSYPNLCIVYVWMLLITGQVNAIEDVLRKIEEGVASGRYDEIASKKNISFDELQGEIAAIRGYITLNSGDVQRSIVYGEDACKLLPADNLMIRSIVILNLGQAHRFLGNITAAWQACREAKELSQRSQNMYTTLAALYCLGQIEVERGELHSAVKLYHEGIQLASHGVEHIDTYLPAAGFAFVGLGQALVEQYELEAATHHLMRGLELGQIGHHVMILRDAYIGLAWIKQAQGDYLGALEETETAIELLKAANMTIWSTYPETQRARLWVTQGSLDKVLTWKTQCNLSDEDDIASHHLNEYIVLARLLMAQGERANALTLLQRIRSVAQREARVVKVIETSILLALAYAEQKDNDSAQRHLTNALTLAEPRGYVRMFANEGTPMGRLLLQMAAPYSETDFVIKVLAACQERASHQHYIFDMMHAPGNNLSHGLQHHAHIIEPPVESLTARELEILRLTAAGLSNRAIALELIIALGTVKSHLHRIYGKLGVTSRTQAIAQARALNLFSS